MTKLSHSKSNDGSDYRPRTGEAVEDMLQDSQERQAEVSALLEGSRAVLEYREFQDAARSIFDSCKKLIGATGGYIAILSEDGAENEVLFLDSGGLGCTVDESLPMPIRGLREQVYRTGKAAYHNGFSQSEWAHFLPDGHVIIENVLFAPLLADGNTVGLLGLANKPGGFNGNDARMASAFGELAAIALRNSRTLEAMESREQHFRSVTQSASDGIISANTSGQIVYWNEAAERMFGYSADAVIGKPLTLIMPKRFRQDHQKGIKRVVSTGQSRILGHTVELVGLRDDGSEFPVELSLSSWKTKEGTFLTGILRDITERKQAEEKIKNLARFPSENPHPVLRISADGTVLYANAVAELLLDSRGSGVGKVLPAEWNEVNTDTFGTSSKQQTDILHDERIFSFEVVPVSGTEYVNWYGRDATKRRQAEDALQKAKDSLEINVQKRTAELRAKEASLAEAQRIAHLGNWDWNIHTNELFWSDEVYRIFGFRPQEFVVTNDFFLKCVHPADRKRVNEAVNRLLEKPDADYRIDHRVILPDGSERIVHERGEIILNPEGRPVRMIGTVHDITERKKLEREILNISADEQRRIAQELHDGLGQELTGLSYLAKSLYQRLQTKGMAEAENAAELTSGIPQVLGQLQTIVKGLLPLEIDAGDLIPALQVLAANVEERTGVTCCLESNGPVLTGSAGVAVQLYRIAQEAVNNAVKHAQSQHIVMVMTADRGQIKLEICDDGVGIQANAEKPSGSGLRIMRHRAHVIGGTLNVTAGARGGTIVSCTVHQE